ncbi:MAG: hypothetical protein U9R49_00260 [Bacteroidota bacterium]|nr:hypothetical protein [Bacteroidota bacterium]
MKTYDELRDICERTSRISERVIDNFLLAYAAGHQGLGKQMERQFDRFRHVGKKLGKEVMNMLRSQYLAHRVFKQEGLLGKFLKHPALDRFTGAERDFLLQQHKLPWRFLFSTIVDSPAEDFYTMEDVFTGKMYLLFSPGVSRIRIAASPVLWFNLIGFNGFCWQSFGPVAYYKSFVADDIFFFATELNPHMEEADELNADVERNPLPYMMLVSGADYPLTFHKEDELLFLLAEHDLEALDTATLKTGFKTEYEKGVYRISHKQWAEHPHFAQAWFDEQKKLLLFSAMTLRGFERLVKDFNAFGHNFPAEPYLRVHMSMLTTASEILNKDVVLNEYLDLFQLDSDPDKDKVLEDINAFIALVLPDINAGLVPDIEEAARKTGVDPDTARSVVESVMGSLDKIPGKKPPAAKKKTAAKKTLPAIRQLPPQPAEGVRLIADEDKILFDLHLYMLAGEIRREVPWEYLGEDDVFGVQLPGKDLVYFVSVMGGAGEFLGLSFYRGYEGLAGFLEFRAEIDRLSDLGQSDESIFLTSLLPGGLLTVPHLMLSYTDRDHLEKEDLAAIKKSGARFRGRGKWPRIEEIIPGYVGGYPSGDVLRELFLVMQQVLIVLEKDMQDEQYMIREDDPAGTILIRVPSGKGPRFRWKDHYLVADPAWGETSYSVKILPASSAALSRLLEAGQELQLELFLLPSPVREKGSRDYFPFVLMMVDKLTELIVSMSVLSPQPDLQSMHESIPQKVLDELIKTGHRPSKIEVRSELLFGLLEEILEKAGCPVERTDLMPQMDEAIRSMISQRS